MHNVFGKILVNIFWQKSVLLMVWVDKHYLSICLSIYLSWIYFEIFPQFYKGDNFVIFCLVSCTPTMKGNNLLPELPKFRILEI